MSLDSGYAAEFGEKQTTYSVTKYAVEKGSKAFFK
jgi:hypothetical protein